MRRVVCVFAATVLFAALAGLRVDAATRPPLLAGETPWHASWHNPTNRALHRVARCETGYLPGRRVNWRHSNSVYAGGLGFTHGTWAQYRVYVRPLPPAQAWRASVTEQLAVGRKLVQLFGWTPWPVCSIRLGLRAG